MSRKKVIVVGSSNVIFTYSYIMSLSEVSDIVGYIDVGVQNIELPIRLKNIPKMKYSSNRTSLGIKSNIKKLLKRIGIDRNKYILSLVNKIEFSKKNITSPELKEFIFSRKPDHILYIWSTTVKKIKSDISSIIEEDDMDCKQSLLINTYPVRSNIQYDEYNPDAKVDAEYFNSFDKLILTSDLMKEYFTSSLGINESSLVLHQDKLHSSFFKYNKKSNIGICNEISKVIFLGNTNFKERTIDDVSGIIKKLAEGNVEVWIQSSGDKIKHHNVKYFNPYTYQEMLDGKLSTFVSQFNAVIMLYNDLDNLRSNISYPTRFAMGTLGLIPILIKSNQFKAIEELYKNNNTVVLFDNYQELLNICKNKEFLLEKTKLIRENLSEVMENHDSSLRLMNELYEN
ncbi:hypothetical protein [Vibrio tritonius]|uniref:hypothetical protein n=1 Tax=Vibrio tritonius TaxID=1435069 RepID=UPI00083888DF|nr:hypothetical protein [Vibrio tritonius]